MKRWWAGLIFVLVLAAILRFYRIGAQCYWMDEIVSLQSSSGQTTAPASLPADVIVHHLPLLAQWKHVPLTRLWRVSDTEVSPPLYLILLHIWRGLFGDSETAVRCLSALASVAAVGLLFGVMSMQTSTAAALWGAIVFALASPQIHAAQDARNYAMWVALSLATACALLTIEKRGASLGRLIFLAFSTLAMLLTHYFALIIVGALMLYALIFLKERRRICAGLAGGAAMFLGMWGRYLPAQRANAADQIHWLSLSGRSGLLVTIIRFFQIPSVMLGDWGAHLIPAGFCAAILVIGVWLCRGKHWMWFWLFWIVGLEGSVAVMDLWRGSYALAVLRYTLPVGAGVAALLCAFSFEIFKRKKWVVPLIVTCACAATVGDAYPEPRSWKQMADELRANVTPDSIVVYTGQPNPALANIMYLGISVYAPHLPGRMVLLQHRTAQIRRKILDSSRDVWLVAYVIGPPPEKLFPNAFFEQVTYRSDVGWLCKMTRKRD